MTDLGGLILWVLRMFSFLLIGRAILSFIDPVGRWQISRVLHDATEWFIAPIRQIVPRTGFIDLSFIVAFLLLRLLENLLATAFYG
jgi:YggT family protein